jgi:hypothetical protein
LTNLAETAVYILCFLTSGLCAVLLGLGYVQSRSRLLFWMTVSFTFLSLSNLGVVLDAVVFPGVDLRILRKAPALIGVAVLIYAFVWEAER